MFKIFALTLYYISVVLYYGFFCALAAGHTYLCIKSYSVDDCYASKDKNNLNAYSFSGAVNDEFNVS